MTTSHFMDIFLNLALVGGILLGASSMGLLLYLLYLLYKLIKDL